MENRFFNNPQIDEKAPICLVSCGFCIGERVCESHNYAVHYVMEGEGSVRISGRKYNVKTGDFFIIYPNDEVKYPSENMFTHCYCDFTGSYAEYYLEQTGIKKGVTVFHRKSDSVPNVVKNCLSYVSQNKYSQLLLNGYVLEFLGCIDEALGYVNDKLTLTDKYAKAAIKFIEYNIGNEKFTITDVANHLKIDRSHLYRVFKTRFGISPTDFIINLKIDVAKRLLIDQKPIKDIVKTVGIDDVYYFSKLFKKRVGVCPSHFKKLVDNEHWKDFENM